MNRRIVPFVNLGVQYKSIQTEIMDTIDTVLQRGDYILGESVSKFEQVLANYCGTKYAIGVGSGTDALVLSLLALGVQNHDEVITTPFTFPATINAIIRVGAVPIFVDIEQTTFNIDISKVEKKISPKTKAVLPVHLFGQACNLGGLKDLSLKHGLRLVEDAAQAIGAKFKTIKVGNSGDASAFSFYPTKNIGAYGDGGAVVTNSENVSDYVKTFRTQGARMKGFNEAVGLNSRLDELQAAILLVKFKYLDEWIGQRRKIAGNYTLELKNTPLICPVESIDAFHTYYQYTILVPFERDRLVRYLDDFGIQTKIYYPTPLYSQPAYTYLGYKAEEFPVCRYVCDHVLSLPCYPELTSDNQEYIIAKIRSFYS